MMTPSLIWASTAERLACSVFSVSNWLRKSAAMRINDWFSCPTSSSETGKRGWWILPEAKSLTARLKLVSGLTAKREMSRVSSEPIRAIRREAPARRGGWTTVSSTPVSSGRKIISRSQPAFTLVSVSMIPQLTRFIISK
jgi:hypothetical protein